jgi:hypothetical protein
MADTSYCAHSVKVTEDEHQVWRDCGAPTYVVFSQQVRVMGRMLWRRHPRCTVHASADTIKAAHEQGYTVEYLEERV